MAFLGRGRISPKGKSKKRNLADVAAGIGGPMAGKRKKSPFVTGGAGGGLIGGSEQPGGLVGGGLMGKLLKRRKKY